MISEIETEVLQNLREHLEEWGEAHDVRPEDVYTGVVNELRRRQLKVAEYPRCCKGPHVAPCKPLGDGDYCDCGCSGYDERCWAGGGWKTE